MHFLRFLQIFWSTFLLLTFLGISLTLLFANLDLSVNWQTASRASAHIAPLPEKYKDAIVEVYAARAFGWRGIFAQHMWLATKEKDAKSYKIYQVIGWLSFFGRSPLSITEDIPDKKWFGQKPKLIKEIRGDNAEQIINKIDQVAREYPYKDSYVFWPGPNSNTFIAYIARKVPEMHLVMPPLAIGKDYLGSNKFISKTPSGTGYQISLLGLLGITLAKDEGLEINILSLVFGINPKNGWLILPGIGYITDFKK